MAKKTINIEVIDTDDKVEMINGYKRYLISEQITSKYSITDQLNIMRKALLLLSDDPDLIDMDTFINSALEGNFITENAE